MDWTTVAVAAASGIFGGGGVATILKHRWKYKLEAMDKALEAWQAMCTALTIKCDKLSDKCDTVMEHHRRCEERLGRLEVELATLKRA